MYHVASIGKSNTILVRVKGVAVIDKLISEFDLHIASGTDQVILDAIWINEVADFEKLCSILKMGTLAPFAEQIRNSDYVIFHV